MALGTRSCAILPLVAGDVVIGAMALSTCRAEREWSAELVQRIQILAGLFAQALDRMRGEAQAQRLRRELTHASRNSTMGELTASLAHEPRQPLTAILSNAQVARTLLGGEVVDRAELQEILSDIVQDDLRADELIPGSGPCSGRTRPSASPWI